MQRTEDLDEVVGHVCSMMAVRDALAAIVREAAGHMPVNGALTELLQKDLHDMTVVLCDMYRDAKNWRASQASGIMPGRLSDIDAVAQMLADNWKGVLVPLPTVAVNGWFVTGVPIMCEDKRLVRCVVTDIVDVRGCPDGTVNHEIGAAGQDNIRVLARKAVKWARQATPWKREKSKKS